MKFTHLEINELNKRYNLHLNYYWTYNSDFYEELNKQLEKIKVYYYFTSFNEKDVIEDLKEMGTQHNYELIEVENVYIVIIL